MAGPRIKAALDSVDVVIAADGGAASLDHLGFVPNVLIGDLDSISEARLSEFRVTIPEILQFPTQKDETDADLALGEAVARGATEITILGAFGGPRVDHELANVLLLAGPLARGREVRLLTESFEVWGVSNAARVFAAEIGDTVSLIPVSANVTDVTTDGLEWKLDRASLTLGSTQAISNVAAASRVSVSVGNGTVILLHHFGSEA